jgi:Pentapeptide repeats (8 copies)
MRAAVLDFSLVSVPLLTRPQCFMMESLKRFYVAAALLTVSIVLLLTLLWLPEWMVNQYNGQPFSRIEYTNAVNEYRKTLSQIMGGCALLVGLYFTWRTTRTAEDGRITDRFSRAVEQLGATNKDGSKQIEPRLGGIYSLERIAGDSKRDARAIVELLCAYVRENAPRQTDRTSTDPNGEEPERKRIGTDIQAILTLLSRFRPEFRNDPSLVFDLNTTDLFRADMSGCELDCADLRKVDLARADLSKGRLESADLTSAYMLRAKLTKARLTKSCFYRANLLGANLSEANLTRANLKKAVMGLTGNDSTNLRGTILKETNLIGVDLRYVSGLSAKQVLMAIRDETTILPEAVVKEIRSLGIVPTS